MRERNSSDDTTNKGVLNIIIQTSRRNRSLAIPTDCIKEREVEMKRTAIVLGIPESRWSGSLLYQEWKKQLSLLTSELEIILHPERDSRTLSNNTWITQDTLDWIQTYYVTGTLQIPRTARGYDVLAAVEYFGILYQPDQCHFADYSVYKRVQQWSCYLCHRADLVQSVVKHLEENPNSGSVAFETSVPNAGDSLLLGGNDKDSSGKSLSEIASKLFNGSDQSSDLNISNSSDESTLPEPEEQTAQDMRDDFVSCLQNALSDETVVEFVIVAGQAVLEVDLPHDDEPHTVGKQSRTKSELSAPVDELVGDEIAKGRLEELMEQVDARNGPVSLEDSKIPDFEQEFPSKKYAYESFSDQFHIVATTTSTESDDSLLKRAIQQEFAAEAPEDEMQAVRRDSDSFRKRKKKQKPVFVLPDNLVATEGQIPRPKQGMKNPVIFDHPEASANAPFTGTVIRASEDTTVTSALTGPFYMDENGNLRDVFEQLDGEEDDDTRAQAMRHEWIQTALLNRGIDERMETLLNATDEEQEQPILLDPWDWLTGLGVCEFSRSMMESLEQYAQQAGIHKPKNAQPSTPPAETKPMPVTPDAPTPNEEVKESSIPIIQTVISEKSNESDSEEIAQTPAPPPLDDGSAKIPCVKDRVMAIAFEQACQEDKPDVNSDFPDREDSSDFSKESPRGVEQGASIADESASKSLSWSDYPDSSQNTMEVVEKNEGEKIKLEASSAKKKAPRGIKALFRRRRGETKSS